MKKSILFITFVLLTISLFGQTSIGWGNLQYPLSISIVQSDTTDNIYGQVWMDGVTPGAGAGVGITAELGYGVDGTTPDETWTWFTATYFGESGNNDEYIYNLVCSMVAGEYDYTYRYHYTGDIDYYYAGEIGALAVNAVPPPTYDVTFQVDMQYQTVDPAGVFLAGSFNGWNTTATPLDPPTRDNVYTVTLQLESTYYEYKFLNGATYENVANRHITTPEEDHVIPVVFFEDFGGGTAIDVDVTFSVYMGGLDPAWYTGGVSIQGSVAPLDWIEGVNFLTDLDEDLVYTGMITFPVGSDYDVEYKFARNDSEPERTWYWEDSNNRPFVIDDSGSTQTIEMNYWNDSMPIPQNIATEIVGDDVVISWDPVFGADTYNVYRSVEPYDNFQIINFTAVSDTSFPDINAAIENKYFYQVKANRN